LLKALEEPVARTVWILCAPSLEDVIITIRSRSRHVRLRTPPVEAVAALPGDSFVSESETPGYFRWRDTAGEIESDFSGHLLDHVDDVRAWLARG